MGEGIGNIYIKDYVDGWMDKKIETIIIFKIGEGLDG